MRTRAHLPRPVRAVALILCLGQAACFSRRQVPVTPSVLTDPVQVWWKGRETTVLEPSVVDASILGRALLPSPRNAARVDTVLVRIPFAEQYRLGERKLDVERTLGLVGLAAFALFLSVATMDFEGECCLIGAR